MAIRIRGRRIVVGLLVPLCALGALLFLMAPGTGMSKIPPEEDGARFSWPGAVPMNVDVLPWGGGYVRSDPYKIDCPLACVRSWNKGQKVTLTANPTPGYTFSHWEGACTGTSSSCSVEVGASVMDVTAVFTGHYVPPASSGGSSARLVATTSSGSCPTCFAYELAGTGFKPNSTVSIAWDWTTPDGYTGSSTVTTDSSGAFSQSYGENCQFTGVTPYSDTYSGPVVVDVTASDTGGGNASAHISGGAATCPS